MRRLLQEIHVEGKFANAFSGSYWRKAFSMSSLLKEIYYESKQKQSFNESPSRLRENLITQTGHTEHNMYTQNEIF